MLEEEEDEGIGREEVEVEDGLPVQPSLSTNTPVPLRCGTVPEPCVNVIIIGHSIGGALAVALTGKINSAKTTTATTTIARDDPGDDDGVDDHGGCDGETNVASLPHRQQQRHSIQPSNSQQPRRSQQHQHPHPRPRRLRVVGCIAIDACDVSEEEMKATATAIGTRPTHFPTVEHAVSVRGYSN